MKNKKALLIFTLIAVIAVTGCGKKGNNENNNGSTLEPNTNQGVVADKEIDVFTLKNTSLIWDGNQTELETTITNTSDEDAYIKGFNVKVYDEEGNVMATMYGYVGSNIKAHSSRVMSTGHFDNLSTAARVEYEVVK